MFDPLTKKYPYPEDTSTHYLDVKKDNGLVFDKNYPYIDKRKSFRFKQWLVRVLLRILVFWLSRIRLGLKIKGRKNIKKYKDVIKDGIISVSNHVHMWDYISILDGIRSNKPYYLAWPKNVRGENGKLVRLTGGIPIPENVSGTKEFLKTVNNHLQNGGWIHIYSEGSMWEFYKPIRPFKKGAAYFACKNNKPILPLAYSYRKSNWIRRKIFRQIACFTLNIGEPIYKDDNLDKSLQEEDLTRRSHEAVCRLASIDPKDNIYDAIYNDSKRIDYY